MKTVTRIAPCAMDNPVEHHDAPKPEQFQCSWPLHRTVSASHRGQAAVVGTDAGTKVETFAGADAQILKRQMLQRGLWRQAVHLAGGQPRRFSITAREVRGRVILPVFHLRSW